MAAHSSELPWRILWVEEPGRLQSVGSHRVGHDLACMPSDKNNPSQGSWGITPILLHFCISDSTQPAIKEVETKPNQTNKTQCFGNSAGHSSVKTFFFPFTFSLICLQCEVIKV